MNPETIVYLKDQTFIPDFIRVNSGVDGCVVNFCNDESDDTLHMLRCKRKFDSSDFTIKAGESIQMRFPATGRFEITNPCNGLMKVCLFTFFHSLPSCRLPVMILYSCMCIVYSAFSAVTVWLLTPSNSHQWLCSFFLSLVTSVLSKWRSQSPPQIRNLIPECRQHLPSSHTTDLHCTRPVP